MYTQMTLRLASMIDSFHHIEKPMDLSKAFNTKFFKIKSLYKILPKIYNS